MRTQSAPGNSPVSWSPVCFVSFRRSWNSCGSKRWWRASNWSENWSQRRSETRWRIVSKTSTKSPNATSTSNGPMLCTTSTTSSMPSNWLYSTKHTVHDVASASTYATATSTTSSSTTSTTSTSTTDAIPTTSTTSMYATVSTDVHSRLSYVMLHWKKEEAIREEALPLEKKNNNNKPSLGCYWLYDNPS